MGQKVLEDYVTSVGFTAAGGHDNISQNFPDLVCFVPSKYVSDN